MANGSTLPPQAYTREVLAAAFNWLQHQPDSTRRLATTPDALVGLYLRAQRYGSSTPEQDAPVSSQNFISDLKNLAEGLRQFEETKGLGATQKAPSRPHSSSAALHAAGNNHPLQNNSTLAPMSMTGPNMNFAPPAGQTTSSAQSPMASQSPLSQIVQPTVQSSPAHSFANPIATGHLVGNHSGTQTTTMTGSVTSQTLQITTSNTPNINLIEALNPNTRSMIREVQASLNLSNDAETLNMLVAIAYKNMKNLLG